MQDDLQNIKDAIVQILEYNLVLEKGKLDPSMDRQQLYSNYCLDSLDEIEIVLSLEEHFDVEFSDDEVLKWDCIEDIIKSIAKREYEQSIDDKDLEIIKLKQSLKDQQKTILSLQIKVSQYEHFKQELRNFLK